MRDGLIFHRWTAHVFVACLALLVPTNGIARAEDLSIAVIGDMSTAGSPAPAMAVAVQLAIEDARSTGKLPQMVEQVRTVVLDDFCKPDYAVAKAREAVQMDRVSLVIGHSCPSASLGASSIYKELNVVLIDPATTNPLLTESNRGKPAPIFRIAAREDRAAAIAVFLLRDAIAGRNITLVGNLYQKAWFDRFQKLAGDRAKGFSVGDTLPDNMTASDVSIVYDPQNRDRGLSHISGSDQVYVVHGPDDRFGTPWGDKDAVRRLADRLKQAHYEPPFGPAINAYASVQVWMKAMKEAASTDPSRVTDQMRKLKFDTIRGPIAFDETGDVQQPIVTIVHFRHPEIEVPNQCNEPTCKDCKCSDCCPK
jgi:branched-chain amino acid transport system substrate-binding protein